MTNFPKPDVDDLFDSHELGKEQVIRVMAIRSAAKEFAGVLLDLTPAGADQSAALRKIREAVFTAVASISLEK